MLMNDGNELSRLLAADTLAERPMNQAISAHDTPLAALTTLRDSEIEFRRLVAGLTDHAICMLGIDGTVQSWNAGGERIQGYHGEEIIGQDFSRFFPPELRNSGEPGKALDVAVHQGKYEAETWRIRKDGRRFWAHVVIDAIRNAAGRLVGFASITRDITEQRA